MASDATRTARQTTRSAVMFAPGRREQQAALRQHEKALIASERLRLRESIAASKASTRARLSDEKSLARAKEALDRQRSSALVAMHRQEERARRTTAQRFTRGVSSSVRGGVGRVAQGAGLAAGVLGGVAVAGALAEESAIRRQAAVLANQAGDPKMKGALAAEATSVRGFSGSEVLQAQGRFVGKTGDVGTARAIKGNMGDLALATGADFGDIMETAGQAFNVLSKTIADPAERLNELNRVMAVLAQQGALGAVEMKDLANDFGKLGAATAKFEGGSPALLRTMGAFAQIAVKHGGAESSADASTAAARLANDMVVNRKRFDAILGPNALQSKADKTKLRNPMEIMGEIIEKTGGDIMKTTGLFGAESGKIFSGLSSVYSAAEGQKKGSGMAALEKEFKLFAGADMNAATVKAGADSVMEEPDKQFAEASKAFNTAVARDLLPALTKLIPQFTQLIPNVASATGALAKFVGWAAENPLSGIGAIIAGSVMKDLAGAGIGKAVQSTLLSLIAQTSMGAGLPAGAAGGLAGKLGAAGMMVGGLALAGDQANSFGKENGGWGGAASFFGVGAGDGFGFAGVDSYMNKQAQLEAASRPVIPPPGTITASGKSALAAGTPAAAPGSAPAAQAAASGQELGGAAKDLKGAAAAIKDAVSSMPRGGKGVSEASRSAPIISPSRG